MCDLHWVYGCVSVLRKVVVSSLKYEGGQCTPLMSINYLDALHNGARSECVGIYSVFSFSILVTRKDAIFVANCFYSLFSTIRTTDKQKSK